MLYNEIISNYFQIQVNNNGTELFEIISNDGAQNALWYLANNQTIPEKIVTLIAQESNSILGLSEENIKMLAKLSNYRRKSVQKPLIVNREHNTTLNNNNIPNNNKSTLSNNSNPAINSTTINEIKDKRKRRGKFFEADTITVHQEKVYNKPGPKKKIKQFFFHGLALGDYLKIIYDEFEIPYGSFQKLNSNLCRCDILDPNGKCNNNFIWYKAEFFIKIK